MTLSADGGPPLHEVEILPPQSQDSAPEQEVVTLCSVEALASDVLVDGGKIQEVPDVLRVNAEDAQFQTEILPPPPPSPPLPPPPLEEAEPTAPDKLAAAEKKDVATSVEELKDPQHLVPLQTSGTSSLQDPAAVPNIPVQTAVAQTEPSAYANDSEPRPKPSNELTRDYIPKVGMTTYTIVPQKSLEKLRYFEVALTLERQEGTEGAGLDALTPPLPVEEKEDVLSPSPEKEALTATAAAAPTQCTANGNESSTAAPASSTTLIKVAKIPPATKPKPGSFRLAQHKKPPGYYMTSAAEKHLQREVWSSDLPLPPPPSPPPAAPPLTDCANETSPKASGGVGGLSRQSSLPSRSPVPTLSLEKLRSFATPRPFTPSSPSRFAQAVSSAVKRSQSLSYASKSGSSSPVRASLSPISSPPPTGDPKGLAKLKVGSGIAALKTH